jgi:hypothetical protein
MGLSDEFRAFATERAHQDARATNEIARTAAQIAILINGAAATAVLANFSKAALNSALVVALPGYAIGATCGAIMIWRIFHALELFNTGWAVRILPDRQKTKKNFERRAKIWVMIAHFFFASAIFAFVVASAAIAFTIYCPTCSLIGGWPVSFQAHPSECFANPRAVSTLV